VSRNRESGRVRGRWRGGGLSLQTGEGMNAWVQGKSADSQTKKTGGKPEKFGGVQDKQQQRGEETEKGPGGVWGPHF